MVGGIRPGRLDGFLRNPQWSSIIARHEATAMNVADGRQWVVGLDRPVGQHADRGSTKRALDTNFVGGDIGQIRLRNGADDLEQVGAALRQRISGQRLLWQHSASASRDSGSTSSMVLMGISCVRSRLDETVRQHLLRDKPALIGILSTASA
jgi:hypothetical protein